MYVCSFVQNQDRQITLCMLSTIILTHTTHK